MRDFAELIRELVRANGWSILRPNVLLPAFAYLRGTRTLPITAPLPKRALTFPADHLPHDGVLEWWYWNGFFETEDGTPFAFHHAIFLLRPHAIDVPPALQRRELAPVAFSSVTNLRDRTTRKHAYLSRRDDLIRTNDRFELALDAHRITYGNGEVFQVTDDRSDLTLTPTVDPIPVNGSGYLSFPLQPMFYYSLPRLSVAGTLAVGSDRLPVNGTAWMDHQWGNAIFQRFRWTWISAMLEDGTNIVACEYGTDTTRVFVTIQSPDGTQRSATDARFTHTDTICRGARSGYDYPLEWTVEVPSLELVLSSRCVCTDAEMSLGMLHYWECPVNINTTVNGQTISGRGFLEIARSPAP